MLLLHQIKKAERTHVLYVSTAGRRLAQATPAEAGSFPEAPGTDPISDGGNTATSEEPASVLLPATVEEAAPEPETEPESKGEPLAEPEGELGAEAETGADPEAAAEPDTVPEAEADPETEAELETAAEPETEAEAESEGAAEPEMPVVEGEATPSGHFAIGRDLPATSSLQGAASPCICRHALGAQAGSILGLLQRPALLMPAAAFAAQ